MKEIDKGILLRKLNYSDTSLIITFYTFSKGTQSFIFQGGKKKSSALYPMSEVEMEFYKRPDSELGKLTATQAVVGASEIPYHPLRSSIAFFMADVLFHCLKTDQVDQQLYHFLEEQISELNDSPDLSLLPLLFLIRLTNSLGIEPMVNAIDAPYFVLTDGEFREHHGFLSQAESGQHVDFLRKLYQNQQMPRVERDVRMQALHLMLKYMETHIPNFNVNRSMEVLKEVLS